MDNKVWLKAWLKEWRHNQSPYGEKLDRNGYGRSLLSIDETCYYCGCGRTECVRHEVYPGNANRKTSKACGFWINVCPEHHEMYHSIHELRKELARECQTEFEKLHTREDFITLIGKSYL